MTALTRWRICEDRRIRWRLEFKVEDLWVGAFWRIGERGDSELWICVLPCLPLHFQVSLAGWGARA